MLDLTTPTPTYFFVRDVQTLENKLTYIGTIGDYYLGIPGTSVNGLEPNN